MTNISSAANNTSCNFNVVNTEITIDKKKVNIFESKAGLHISIPPIHLVSLVEIPVVPEGEKWTVGWIEAITALMADEIYSQCGIVSAEVPLLHSGEITAINTCDNDEKPWSDKNVDKMRIVGPMSESTSSNIKLSNQVTFVIPWNLPPIAKPSIDTADYDIDFKSPLLTAVYRDQMFIMWLAAHHEPSNTVFPLVSIKWRLAYHFKINPFRKIGKRAKQLAPLLLHTPEIVATESIPQSVLSGYAYDDVVSNVWRSQSWNTAVAKPDKTCQLI